MKQPKMAMPYKVLNKPFENPKPGNPFANNGVSRSNQNATHKAKSNGVEKLSRWYSKYPKKTVQMTVITIGPGFLNSRWHSHIAAAKNSTTTTENA